MNQSNKTRIAHLAGPTATIQNTPPLVTSNKARARHGLPLLNDVDGAPLKHDALRAQRLAAPAKVYVEQFSGHPLEADAAELYGPPDGYIGADGVFRKERRSPDDKPVYEIELKPEDGLYPLPYMARAGRRLGLGGGMHHAGRRPCTARASSRTARGASRRSIACRSASTAPRACCRRSPPSTSIAACRRAASPRACRRICARTRAKAISRPRRAARISSATSPIIWAVGPPRQALAKATNDMQALVSGGDYDGVIWTQGSPQVEESAYWFNLLIDTHPADLLQRRAAAAGPDQRRRTGQHRRLGALHPLAHLGRRAGPQPLRRRGDSGAAAVCRARGHQGRCASGRLRGDRRPRRHRRQHQPHRADRADLPAAVQAHLPVGPEDHRAAATA